MASLLQKLSTALSYFLPGPMVPEMHLMDAAPGFHTLRSPLYGTSKRTVAQDRRRAAKTRARARAKKLGQA